MIEFMVISAPRSGSTWAANWLNTYRTLCLHDPLLMYRHDEIDRIPTLKVLGIACTGIMFFPEWVNKHPARKVILHRDNKEINDSLEAIGLPSGQDWQQYLEKIEGRHHYWTDLFEKPQEIYEYLTKLRFDEERHAILKEIEMQPHFAGLSIGKDVAKRLRDELGE